MKEINQKVIITKIKEEVETALYLYDSNILIWKRSVRRDYLFMTLTIMCITDNVIFSVEYAKLSLQVKFPFNI
jgi:hypothetical protein